MLRKLFYVQNVPFDIGLCREREGKHRSVKLNNLLSPHCQYQSRNVYYTKVFKVSFQKN